MRMRDPGLVDRRAGRVSIAYSVVQEDEGESALLAPGCSGLLADRPSLLFIKRRCAISTPFRVTHVVATMDGGDSASRRASV